MKSTTYNGTNRLYVIRDMILALLFVRGQSYWPEAEGRGLIQLSRGQITVPISDVLFNDNFIT